MEDESPASIALAFPEPGGQAIFRNLKRPALLFDQVKIVHLPGLLAWLSKLGKGDDFSLRAELDWLLEQGVISTPGFEHLLTDFFGEAAGECLPMTSGIPASFEYCFRQTDLQVAMIRTMNMPDARNVLLSSSVTHGMELLSRSAKAYQSDRPAAKKLAGSTPEGRTQEVIQIMLASFPFPDENTSWEQIVDFREDPDSKKKQLALRRWMRKIAREDVSASELAEEIKWLMNEYQDHMALHRVKASTGAIEAIVTGAGELVENLAKLRFGALAKSLFTAKRREIEMLQAERESPGRELAYIVSAQERFRR